MTSAGERQPLLGPLESSNDVIVSKGRRLGALALLFLFSTGANWTEACLGPLKASLIEQLNISNTQYGVISASTQLANTVLPILLGIWIDRVGAARTSVFATLAVCSGAVLAALACNSLSYPLLVVGRIIQGTGVIMVDTAATKLIVKWSRDADWLGLAISCNFAFDRAAAAISKATAVPIAKINSNDGTSLKISNTFWTASVISTISLLAAVAYSRFERLPTKRDQSNCQTNRNSSNTSTAAIFHRTMNSLPVFFILIAITQLYQPIAVFNNLSADILRWRGSSPVASGHLSSIGQIMPIFIAPLLGGFFDRYGHRLEFVPLTAFLFGLSIAVLTWTSIPSLSAMIVFSLANALNTPPYLTSLAILFKDESTFGCSWGIWKTLMQSNQIIMNTTLGKIQDATPNKGYQYVLTVFFISKVIEFIWGLSYIAFDQLYASGILSSNEKRRKLIESERQSAQSWGTQPNYISTRLLYLYLIIVISSAWYLFFTSYS